MPVVGLLPEAELPVYETPFNWSVATTVLPVIWNSVKGEPAGVQEEPMLALEQPATVPTPGAMYVKSKVTGAATPPVKLANAGTKVFPVTGPPVRLWIDPPVSPANAPVCVAPVVLVNVGLKLIAPPLTVTFPAMFASPVMGAAFAEVEISNTGTASKLAHNKLSFFIIKF